MNKINFFSRSFFLLIIVTNIFYFINCSKDTRTGPTPLPPDITKPILDTNILPGTSDPVINISGKISITIPKEVIPVGGTNLKIKQVTTTSLKSSDSMVFHYAYDVTLSTGTSFSKPLTITMNYDPSKNPPGPHRNKIYAAFYSSSDSVWVKFSNWQIDTVNHTVTFTTNHLTTLSIYHIAYMMGYTDYYQTPHFMIYYNKNNIPSNSVYNAFPSRYTGNSNPHYIIDVGWSLEEVYDRFSAKGLKVHWGVQNIWITDLGTSDDGYYNALTQTLNFTDGKNRPGIIEPGNIQQMCAHEYFHYICDYYYSMVWLGRPNKWWLEATASCADRLVWTKPGSIPSYQTEDENFLSYDNNFAQSWDVCSTDPEYYIAGAFIGFMMDQGCLNLADVIKDGGENTGLSYYRTVTDNKIKAKCPQSSISSLYKQFITRVFNSSIDPVTFNTEIVPQKVVDVKTSGSSLVLSHNTFEKLQDIVYLEKNHPYLSAWIYHVYNKISAIADTFKQTFKVYAENLPAGVSARLYVKSKDQSNLITTKFIGELLNVKDSLEFDINDKNKTLKDIHAEILVINSSKDNNHTAKLKVVPVILNPAKPSVPVDLVCMPLRSSNVEKLRITCSYKILKAGIAPTGYSGGNIADVYYSAASKIYYQNVNVTFGGTGIAKGDVLFVEAKAGAPSTRETGIYWPYGNIGTSVIDKFIGWVNPDGSLSDSLSLKAAVDPQTGNITPLGWLTYKFFRRYVDAGGKDIMPSDTVSHQYRMTNTGMP